MTGNITLTVKTGSLQGRTYVFPERRTCLIGRAEDCGLQLDGDPEFWTVSRHHCLLVVGPPHLSVRDLGSRNGTSINGMQIGHPRSWSPLAGEAEPKFMEYELHTGDELRVGDTVFEVYVPATENASDYVNEWQMEEEPSCTEGECVPV